METGSESVTVFRSADAGAEAEAAEAAELLTEAGIAAEVLDDSVQGVPAGAYEVRVPASAAARSEALLSAAESEIADPGDASHGLDLVTVFSSATEMESFSVRGVLDANGIPSMVAGGTPYLSLPIEVKVPRSWLAEAERVIEESRSAGPAAAEEAEARTEGK